MGDLEKLDNIPGIVGYAVVRADDGAVETVKGSSTASVGDLTAFFSSAGEVIRDSLNLGDIQYISICYGNSRLVIFTRGAKYLGVEIPRETEPGELIKKIEATEATEPKVEIQLPRSISSKLQQINLLIDEFGGKENKNHWLALLNQGLGILGGDLNPYVGNINLKFEFKDNPPAEKEDDFVQALRSIIDFLVKKAVEEMGSSQARAKVQAVIEKMR
ncbi:hypothetical protein A2Y85_00430 [candidate division WOR-3 bacterium RBG_13_43_14]|uniref:Roadblock/LAMTOR2 domain-containing protein n=1 Tax=candidate division WOR-3 bacterium RBG_13_43_14 TaxID=1802590 RepID=A0A1F4UBA7_UNCW3|nr:MAG: hypothetical protein A2Y85_00430 [candidate division WOR-3 bacterium RBG_13_43_14]